LSADRLRIALGQLNPTVGDLAGNEAKAAQAIADAKAAGAQLLVLPELMLTGYPPEDLLLKEHFLHDAREALDRLAAAADGLVVLAGYPERAEDVFNAAAILAGGEVAGIYRKVLLPNYGVFDEQRYFQAGPGGATFDLGDLRIGVTVCEDMWEPGPPASDEAVAGATVLVNLSASPYHRGKGIARERMFAQRARDNVAVVALCNLVGGQDELVFDGHSLVLDHMGNMLARGPQFAEALIVADVEPAAAAAARLRDASARPAARLAAPRVRTLAELPDPGEPTGTSPEPVLSELLEDRAEVYGALVTGLRDYVEKNGFDRVVLGLSGGIDSALVACVAADALGPERVSVAIMPSPYSSSATQQDARDLADVLGVERHEFDIAPAMEAYTRTLAEPFAGREEDLTEENLQARIRGNLLMALSNKFGWLVLTTGNKSENSVGYSTLYGDSAGGFAVIKDVPKLLVYDLVRFRNERDPDLAVPASILDRAPSAELRADQLDEDSLPPYEVLDVILEDYIEQDLDAPLIAERHGFAPSEVERVIRLVDRAEYKRRQMPPGVKITTRAFGRERRMPITNRYGR
jgi:NAD+ synthase (glutamine-hydrolysing)